MKNILFLQGGSGEEDHAADAKLVDSLKVNLGTGYQIHYPMLPEEQAPDFGRMKQITNALEAIKGEAIIAAHSFGASMLVKYLSENSVGKRITGVFLIATPYWNGDEDWQQGLKLKENFADTFPRDFPVFLYHSWDDEEVPFAQLDFYAKNLPWATVREIAEGGHQLNDDLSMVAEDIKSL